MSLLEAAKFLAKHYIKSSLRRKMEKYEGEGKLEILDCYVEATKELYAEVKSEMGR